MPTRRDDSDDIRARPPGPRARAAVQEIGVGRATAETTVGGGWTWRLRRA